MEALVLGKYCYGASLEVVLYGAPHCGYGWYAVGPAELAEGHSLPGGRKSYGEGGSNCYCRSTKQATYEAVKALRLAGAPVGAPVLVVSPSGRRMKPTEVS